MADTLEKYRGLASSLRRTFEALRGEDKLLKKQPYGENVDIDALVEAYADSTIGMEMSDRLFTKMHKLERDIAVMFMVDMSGSTKGWINDAEREALVLLCESLETLGDRYAIYGFSGMTRKRCEVYRVKSFDEAYSEAYERHRLKVAAVKLAVLLPLGLQRLGDLAATLLDRPAVLGEAIENLTTSIGTAIGSATLESIDPAVLLPQVTATASWQTPRSTVIKPSLGHWALLGQR